MQFIVSEIWVKHVLKVPLVVLFEHISIRLECNIYAYADGKIASFKLT